MSKAFLCIICPQPEIATGAVREPLLLVKPYSLDLHCRRRGTGDHLWRDGQGQGERYRKNSSVSFDNDRQVEFTSISKFEKLKALFTLEKLVGKEPNVHFVVPYALQSKSTLQVQ